MIAPTTTSDELLSEISAPETRCYHTPGLAPGYPGAPTLPVGIALLPGGSVLAHYMDEPSETYPSLSALLEAHPVTEESWATVPAELRIALLGEKAAEDERAIQRLPPQDAALVAEGGAPLATSGREAIVAWYRSAAQAGDMDLVEAIDRLGEDRAAELYEAAAPWLQEVR